MPRFSPLLPDLPLRLGDGSGEDSSSSAQLDEPPKTGSGGSAGAGSGGVAGDFGESGDLAAEAGGAGPTFGEALGDAFGDAFGDLPLPLLPC